VVEGGSYNARVGHLGGCGPQEYYANMIFTCAGCTAQSADVSYTNVYRFTSGGVGFVPFSIVNDTLAEGPETFQIRIFKRGGALLAASNLITIDANDQCTSSSALYRFSDFTFNFGGCPPVVYGPSVRIIEAGDSCWARVTGSYQDMLMIGDGAGNNFVPVAAGCPNYVGDNSGQVDYVFQPGGNFSIAAAVVAGAVSYEVSVQISPSNPLP
jgi:hypothetical protein